MINLLRSALAHPLTRDLDINAPATTALRRRVVREKPFLFRLYQEWYERIVTELPEVPGTVLELGSGAPEFDTKRQICSAFRFRAQWNQRLGGVWKNMCSGKAWCCT